jgi:hypothetical protein
MRREAPSISGGVKGPAAGLSQQIGSTVETHREGGKQP